MDLALWTSMRALGIVYGGTAALLMSVLLAGCATAPFPKPADFSFHTPAPPLDIHWTLSVDPSVVQADGLTLTAAGAASRGAPWISFYA